MLRGLFGPRHRERGVAEREAAERIKAAARAVLGMGVEVTVSEIECLDPACPGVETVLLVMRPGERTRAVKIARAMTAVSLDEVRAALAEPTGEGSR